MGDNPSTSEAHKAKCCDICGDKGVLEALVTCTRCKVSCEHLYCMRICRVDSPEENWCCEDCEGTNKKFSPKPGMREEAACKKLHSYWDRRKSISGKTKPLSSEEVIKLSSGATMRLSPVQRTSRSCPAPRNNTAPSVKSSYMHLESSSKVVKAPAPSPSAKSSYMHPESSSKVVKAPAPAPSVKSSYMHPESSSKVVKAPAPAPSVKPSYMHLESSLKVVKAPAPAPSVKSSYMHPESSSKVVKSPAPTPFVKSSYMHPESSSKVVKVPAPAPSVKSNYMHPESSSKVVKAPAPAPSKHFKPHKPTSPQMNVVAQQELPQSFKGAAALNELETTSSVYQFVGPSLHASWNGSFKVSSSSKQWEISDEIQAYPPSRVLSKVHKFSTLMPEVLQFELVPRWGLWVDIIQKLCVDKRDIGLYFFPRNIERWGNYAKLLEFIEAEDLAMITRVEGVELLIFTSKLLSEDCQNWNGRHFLWGLYKKKSKSASQVNAHEFHTEPDSTEVEVEMDIDMIGGKDVVGRTDIPVPKESLQPTLPDMTMDMEIDEIGGKDVGRKDIVVSKESLRLPPREVKAELHDNIPPGFEKIYLQRLQNPLSFPGNFRR